MDCGVYRRATKARTTADASGVFCVVRCKARLGRSPEENLEELRGIYHAPLQQQSTDWLVLVMDSKDVQKGVVEWSVKWRRHGWQCSTGKVGHQSMWEEILWLQEAKAGRGGWGCVHTIPLGCPWVEWAKLLGKMGKFFHPNNLLPFSRYGGSRRGMRRGSSLSAYQPMEGP